LGRSAKKILSRLRFLLHSSSFAQARWISAMSCWEYLTSSGVQKKGQECPWHHVLFESILTCGSCHTYLWIWYTCDLLQFENVSTCDCGLPETVHVSYRNPTCELGTLVTVAVWICFSTCDLSLWTWYTCDCCSLKRFLLVTLAYLRLFMCHIESLLVSLVHLWLLLFDFVSLLVTWACLRLFMSYRILTCELGILVTVAVWIRGSTCELGLLDIAHAWMLSYLWTWFDCW
jgi:hypothetical protein